MDIEPPEYMQLNPVFYGFKADVMTNNEIVLERDFFNNIIMVRKKVPKKIYLITRNKDMTNIKNYHLNALLGNNFQ